MGTNNEYLVDMQLKLAKWDAEVAALVAEGTKASGESRTAYDRRIKELRLARKSAEKSLQTLRAATDSAGAPLQSGMDVTWHALQNALVQVSSDLRKTIDSRAQPQQETAT
jgi:hypothetical protein